VADLYAQACAALDGAGLRQYEISNFAREGHRSLHNCKYWTRAPYLGFGLDAHSMLFATATGSTSRFANADDLDEYMQADGDTEVETVDALGAWEESIFLGLRLMEGVSIADLRRDHPAAWVDALVAQAKVLASDGLMQVSEERVLLTESGRIVSSSIFGELLAGEPVAAL
jgi:oxygen-independent coproporphyrinogen-3 oxidase